jgi:hypothetical protein
VAWKVAKYTFFAVRCKPGGGKKKAFWGTSAKVPSRCQIDILRPLGYSNYPPCSSKSIIEIRIGDQEGVHPGGCGTTIFLREADVGALTRLFPNARFSLQRRVSSYTKGILLIIYVDYK